MTLTKFRKSTYDILDKLIIELGYLISFLHKKFSLIQRTQTAIISQFVLSYGDLSWSVVLALKVCDDDVRTRRHCASLAAEQDQEHESIEPFLMARLHLKQPHDAGHGLREQDARVPHGIL